MTTLVLVRHAQTSNRGLEDKIWKETYPDIWRFQVELKRQLESDPGLSELGRLQAREFAESFAPQLVDLDEHSLVVSSPMRCALETAMPLVRRSQTPPERFTCHAEMFEIGSSILRDERPSELVARLEADFPLTCCEVPSDADYVARSEGDTEDESVEHANARVGRVCAWVDSLLATDDYQMIFVVAHEKLLSHCLRRWMGVSPSQRLTFIHVNTGITILEWSEFEGWKVESVNEQTHMIEGATRHSRSG
jgi:broad specificity phosphatase PhoE